MCYFLYFSNIINSHYDFIEITKTGIVRLGDHSYEEAIVIGKS